MISYVRFEKINLIGVESSMKPTRLGMGESGEGGNTLITLYHISQFPTAVTNTWSNNNNKKKLKEKVIWAQLLEITIHNQVGSGTLGARMHYKVFYFMVVEKQGEYVRPYTLLESMALLPLVYSPLESLFPSSASS